MTSPIELDSDDQKFFEDMALQEATRQKDFATLKGKAQPKGDRKQRERYEAGRSSAYVPPVSDSGSDPTSELWGSTPFYEPGSTEFSSPSPTSYTAGDGKPKKTPAYTPSTSPTKTPAVPISESGLNTSDTAEDGQTLAQQSPWTQQAFQTQWGDQAAVQWARQHNQELAQNRIKYGVAEPKEGASPVPGSPVNTVIAPNRTINNNYVPAVSEQGQPTPVVTPITGTEAPTPAPGAPVTTAGSTKPPASAQVPAARVPQPNDMILIRSKGLSPQQTIRVPRRTVDMTGDPASSQATYTSKYWEVIPDLTTPVTPNTPTNSPEGSPQASAPPTQTVQLNSKNGSAPITLNINAKPVDALANLSVMRRGGQITDAPAESKKILNGIGSLIRGEANGAWAEPYLNDVARIAWARENQNQGKTVDPRDAPVAYIESWKDGFYGSDPSVPLVKELDQQLMDNAVSIKPDGTKAFSWQDAFGPAGESGLISRQIASNDCGPNAFSTIMRSRGYNVDPAQAFQYAKDKGYHNGDQFTGAYNYGRMLKEEAGIDNEVANVDWKKIDEDLSQGRPVTLSSSTHYWVTSAFRDTPRGREYYTGPTGAVAGNKEWSTKEELGYAGASPNLMIRATGNVDPNSRAVKEMNVRPPAGIASRMSISRQTIPDYQGMTGYDPTILNDPNDQSRQAKFSLQEGDAASRYAPLVAQAAEQEQVDPYWVAAILEQESSGDPGAESNMGAKGLMGLMPRTAQGLGVADPSDPAQGIRGGTKYFKQMVQMFDGDLDLALAAYNAGPGAVMQYGGIPPYPETQKYVRDVKAKYQRMARR